MKSIINFFFVILLAFLVVYVLLSVSQGTWDIGQMEASARESTVGLIVGIGLPILMLFAAHKLRKHL